MWYIRHLKLMTDDDKESLRRDQFMYSVQTEPHAIRRSAILEKYPEIKTLMRPEPTTKWLVVATVILQMYTAVAIRHWAWPEYIAITYVLGATANHSLFLAIHELSHNLAFQSFTANKLFAIFANFPIGIAYCATFKRYHIEHHRCLGEEDIDTDVPTIFEGWLITRSSINYFDHTMRKIVYLFFHVFVYALRPMFVKPGLVVPDKWFWLNWTMQITFDLAMAVLCGPGVLSYFLLSTFFAASIHPTAGHFIAEHYVVNDRIETYSYYGPLNYLAYNVGYHNEHHDFPNIPWTGLPRVREIAPEFYTNLPQCASWPGAILRFIVDDSLSPFSRVRRATMGQSTCTRDSRKDM